METQLPAGWRIALDTQYNSGLIESIYVVYQWQRFTKRVGFWRRKANRVGWLPVASFRHKEVAEEFVHSTVRAIKSAQDLSQD